MRTARSLPRLVSGVMSAALAVALLPITAAHADRSIVCANAERGVFADVPAADVHAANIDCVAAYGLTVGVGGGNYDPSGSVRRGQMASFLVNFVEVASATPQTPPAHASRFTDIDGHIHGRNIRIADELRITSGRTATTYAPSVPVTRGQMATFVTQALRAAGADLGPVAPDRFHDDDRSVHQANINTLASVGVVAGVGDDRYDPGGRVTRAQMATFLANAAGLLSAQDAWHGPTLPVDGPQVVLVVPVGDAQDLIEVRWDQAITSTAVGSDFEITGTASPQVVARGETVTTTSDEVLRVSLDESLVPADIYWLEVAADIATDDAGKRNDQQRIAFTFSAPGNGDGGDGGGSGGGGDGDGGGDEPSIPSVVSIITEPAADRLAVTFDGPVTCPTGSAARDAWSFTNGSVVESGTHADGSPDAVVAAAGPSTTCRLEYSVQGVENGDFGTMSYTQPVDAADQVRDADGGALPTLTGFRVTDGVAPTFETVEANIGSDVLRLRFSEPVACATISASQFAVTVGGSPVAVDAYNCAAPAASAITLTVSTYVASGQEVSVTVLDGVTLSDQSLDNRVATATRAGMPV